MKHARPAALAALTGLAPLLDSLRERDALNEKSPGVFYLRSRAFLHFHEDPAGLFADVRLAGDDFERFEVTSREQQRVLLRKIDARLAKS